MSVGGAEEEPAVSVQPRIAECLGCPYDVGNDLDACRDELGPSRKEVVDCECDGGPAGIRREEALVVLGWAVDLEEVAVARLERKDSHPPSRWDDLPEDSRQPLAAAIREGRVLSSAVRSSLLRAPLAESKL